MTDNNFDFKPFAANIERLSNAAGISKTKALIESGAGKDFITNMINKNQIPSISKVLQIAQYFNVSLDYLLGYSPEPQKDEKSEKLLALASVLTESQIDSLIEMSKKFLET